MLRINKIFFQIESNIEAILKEETTLGKDLFALLLSLHPADIAMIISRLDDDHRIALYKKLPEELSAKVFENISEHIQVELLVNLDTETATNLLKKIPVDNLTDLFEYLSDENLKKYLRLLQQKQRTQIISRLTFEPESAGRIMNSEVLTLHKNFTIKKSIALLQKLGDKKELIQRIFVTDKNNKLVGYINIDDLILNDPETVIKNITHENELCIDAHEDQELVVQQMQHYKILSAPVVDRKHNFLGVINADDVLRVVKEEASEDVYKMSGIGNVEHSYFDTPFWKLIWQRSPWLIGLLLLQSVSSFILADFKTVVDKYFIISMFLTMLIGTGGNAGNQSSALVIRGLATGEISRKNGLKVLLREFCISIILAIMLTFVGFIRAYGYDNNLWSAIAVCSALFLIVITSMFLGTLIPILLERFNLDPAHSAAPFLATLMDILGVLIYCIVVQAILS